MNVELVAYTQCVLPLTSMYVPSLAAAICVGKEDEPNVKNFNAAIASGHMSILEHLSFTFLITGISRACSHQLVRHRIASYSQQSQRYTKLTGKDWYVVPDSIVEAGMKMEYQQCLYRIKSLYDEMLEEGVKPEDARFLLPNGTTTKILMTLNARELIHLSRERTCNKAQWEINLMTQKMVMSVPILEIQELCGPKCEFGPCPEAKPCGSPNCRSSWKV